MGSFNNKDIRHSVLIGTLIGNGHIQKTQSNTGQCRLKISHCESEQEYVFWKYNILQNDVLSPPAIDEKNQYVFYTQYSLEMSKYHDMFYKKVTENKYRKVISEEIIIDPISLAVCTWITALSQLI